MDSVWIVTVSRDGELRSTPHMEEKTALSHAMREIDEFSRRTTHFKDPGVDSPYMRIEEWNRYAHAVFGDLYLLDVNEEMIQP